jgi:hypothetical protein
MKAPARRYIRSGGNLITISCPKTPAIEAAKNRALGLYFFVAAGLSDPQIKFVVGRMIDKATKDTFQGRTFYNPPKWGIHFLAPKGKYTLEVVGISFDPVTGSPTTCSVSQDLEIKRPPPGADLRITGPHDSGQGCLSNFAAWGTYGPNDPGTISATLSSAKVGEPPVTVIALTDGDGDWSALFTTLDQPSDDYELSVSDTGGDAPPAPVTGLNLSNNFC